MYLRPLILAAWWSPGGGRHGVTGSEQRLPETDVQAHHDHKADDAAPGGELAVTAMDKQSLMSHVFN